MIRKLAAIVAVLCLLGVPANAAGQWQLVAMENFDGPLAPHWTAYDGSPKCCRATVWSPRLAQIQDGRLKLTATRQADGHWLAAGVGAAGWPVMVRTYGKYVIRVRMDRGEGVSAVALLWPKSNAWPPEIDYYEIAGTDGDRVRETATLHRAGDNAQTHSAYPGDLTQWHTVTVEWLPGSITYFVDNTETGKVTDRSYIPHQPMWPAFQLQIDQDNSGNPLASATGSVSMYVDWFAVYAPAADSIATSPVDSQPPDWWAIALVGALLLGLASVIVVKVRTR